MSGIGLALRELFGAVTRKVSVLTSMAMGIVQETSPGSRRATGIGLLEVFHVLLPPGWCRTGREGSQKHQSLMPP